METFNQAFKAIRGVATTGIDAIRQVANEDGHLEILDHVTGKSSSESDEGLVGVILIIKLWMQPQAHLKMATGPASNEIRIISLGLDFISFIFHISLLSWLQ